jgi:hypothetical protein
MEIDIKVDIGYDEKRDQFYLADFQVVKTEEPDQKKPTRKPKPSKTNQSKPTGI